MAQEHQLAIGLACHDHHLVERIEDDVVELAAPLPSGGARKGKRPDNRTLSKALVALAPRDMEFTEIPIRDLPLYSPDHDADYPPEARALKHTLPACDGVLFVTPEYNLSLLHI